MGGAPGLQESHSLLLQRMKSLYRMCESCTWVRVYFPDRFKGQGGVHDTSTDRKYYLIVLSKHSEGKYHQLRFVMEKNLAPCTGERFVGDSGDRGGTTELNGVLSDKGGNTHL